MKVIESAGQTVYELSKETPSEDIVVSKATEFVKSLEVRHEGEGGGEREGGTGKWFEPLTRLVKALLW